MKTNNKNDLSMIAGVGLGATAFGAIAGAVVTAAGCPEAGAECAYVAAEKLTTFKDVAFGAVKGGLIFGGAGTALVTPAVMIARVIDYLTPN